ncbi:MAG: hypothetical protein P8J87_01860 [Verrucomicrobiales bacterium]|nr:hypothetical protein [Verrucomicrobiales bacterium]
MLEVPESFEAELDWRRWLRRLGGVCAASPFWGVGDWKAPALLGRVGFGLMGFGNA